MIDRFSKLLLISTIAIIVFAVVQTISGNWLVIFLFWAGVPFYGEAFIRVVNGLAPYHRVAGFVIAGLSVLIVVLAFASSYAFRIRAAAIAGLIIVGLAVTGGIGFVHSGFIDRMELGRMADAAIGVVAVYLLQLILMQKEPLDRRVSLSKKE